MHINVYEGTSIWIHLGTSTVEIHVEDLLAILSPCWTSCNHTHAHSILLMHALSQLYVMHSSPFLATSSAATIKDLHK